MNRIFQLPLLAFLCLTSLANAVSESKPNVLFIAVDDMRPELGCYGNKIIKTPNIDRLAARGIVFNKAYCQQAVCSPSRTAILTGLRPDETKVWDLETHFRVAQPDCITLPQHFKTNGYHCAAISKLYHVGFEDGRSWSEPHWYPRGRAVDTDPADWRKQIITNHDTNVQEYSSQQGGGGPRKNGKAGKGPAYEVSPKPDEQLPDGAAAVEAVKRISSLKSTGKPFFLAVGFLKPHLPFVAPKKYWDLYDPSTIPVPTTDKLPEGSPEFAGHNNSELHSYADVPSENPIPATFAKTLRHGYYACISYTDAQIGKLLDALDKEGLASNTIIVLWGDHGWQLGDHGLWQKHTNFEIATRAPLLISMPGSKTAGGKCETPVEFVDVYPTLADVCGLPIPNGLGGKSLKALMENPTGPSQGRVAISQYPRKAPEGPVMGYSIRNDRYRATFWRERNGAKIVATELYDEQNDPAETVNLANKTEHKVLLETLAKHLPPTGSDKSSATTSNGPSKEPRTGRPAAAATDEPRDVRFDRLYPGKTKLSLDEYLAKQTNSDEAKARFTKFDKDKDGFLTREEFITPGR